MYTNISFHIVRMAGITVAICLCILYPFLPGDYDSLAVTLSTAAQAFGVVGLLLVPVGILWLAHELWRQVRSQLNHPVTVRYSFVLVSIIAASFVAVITGFVAYATGGLSVGLILLALWLYILSKWVIQLRVLKQADKQTFNPTPLYLIVIPIAVVLFQIFTATSAAESSRNRAITMSAELITDLESYYLEYGQYPLSLLTVWKDYYPSVVGIEKYYYAPSGDAYNLFFEQPRFLFDNIGTREFVVYNKLDAQTMISHASWILILGSEVVERRQGWYEVHDASTPHWKYFWFD